MHEKRPTFRNAIVNLQIKNRENSVSVQKRKKDYQHRKENKIEIRLVISNTKRWKKKG